ALHQYRPVVGPGAHHPEAADGGAGVDTQHGDAAGAGTGQAPASSNSSVSKSRLVKTLDTSSSSSSTSISLSTFWASADSTLTTFCATMASSDDSTVYPLVLSASITAWKS